MDKTKVERHIDVVNSITKLEELIVRHTILDELVGDTVVIDAKKMMDFIQVIKKRMTDNFSVETRRKEKMYKPLKTAINTMNNERRKRDIDALSPEDDNGETSLGEIPQQAPFGGIKIDKDRTGDS